MSPTTKSALYKGTQALQHFIHVQVTNSKQQRNDAVAVSGDTGSLTAGTATGGE